MVIDAAWPLAQPTQVVFRRKESELSVVKRSVGNDTSDRRSVPAISDSSAARVSFNHNSRTLSFPVTDESYRSSSVAFVTILVIGKSKNTFSTARGPFREMSGCDPLIAPS